MTVLVSVPSEKDFHIFCREQKLDPHKTGAPEAVHIPVEPLTLRAQILEGQSVESAAQLIGQFSQDEIAALVKPVTSAAKPKPKTLDE